MAAGYTNKSVAEIFAEAHKEFGNWDAGKIWPKAMAFAEELYEAYYDVLTAPPCPDCDPLAGGRDAGDNFEDGKETWSNWSTKNEHGKDILESAFAKLDARMGGSDGAYQIFGGCQDLYATTIDKSPLYELYSSTVFATPVKGLESEEALLEEVGRSFPQPWTGDSPEVKWTKDILASWGTLDTDQTRKELGELGYDACSPSAELSDADLDSWIRSILEPFFQEAAGQEAAQEKYEEEVVKDFLSTTAAERKEHMLSGSASLEALQKKLGYAALKRDIEYKEQCFLLSNIQEFAAVKMFIDQKGNKILPDPYGYNSSLMLHGDPYGLMNVLTQSRHKGEFFEMPTQAISALQPMIRLFKIETDDDGFERQVEMKFDSHYRKEDVEEFMATKEMRGHGIGVKNFTFSFEGADPWSSTRSMKAKLVLFANSFSEFMKPREYIASEAILTKEGLELRPVTRHYKYIDLAIRTGGTDPGDQPQDTANPLNKDVRIEDATKLNFRLKAIVGWQPPLLDHTIISGELLDAINDSCITLNLTPTIHEFGIDEMGRTTLTINYWGSAEEFFDQSQFNIFTDLATTVSQIKRRLKYKILNENCDDEALKQRVIDSKNSPVEAEKIRDEKLTNMRSLMNNMLREKKIRFINIALEDLQKYHAGGPFEPVADETMEVFRTALIDQIITVGTEESKDKSGNAIKDVTAAAPKEDGEKPVTSGEYTVGDPDHCVTFFYVGDLIDTILKYIGITLASVPDELEDLLEDPEEELSQYKDALREEINNYRRFADNFMKFRLTLGPIELVNANKKGLLMESKLFNIGDIPISAKYFMEFLNERVFKRERETYTLPEFLNDFFNLFLRDFLNNDSCYGNRSKQKTIIHKNIITAYNEVGDNNPDGLDPITHWCKANNRKRMDTGRAEQYPILNVMGKRDNAGADGEYENEIHYLTYFIARVQPTEQMLGCKKGPCDTGEVDDSNAPITIPGDHERYLWHYQIGKDRGIVKSINLVKSDVPGLAEARWASEGFDNLQQLRVLYNANIKTFLDVSTYPGTYIYVEPRGFDPNTEEDLTQFGIGGYFMIKSAEHTLGPGLAETTIDARWVNEISAGGLGKKAPIQETDEKPVRPRKCHMELLPERHTNTSLDSALMTVAKMTWEDVFPGEEEDEIHDDVLY